MLPRWFHFEIIAELEESAPSMFVFPFAFRRNLAVRQPAFFGRLWRKRYSKAMPAG